MVLAGGAGRRMGGRDKGLIELAGRPLAAHVAGALAPQVGAVLLNANRNREQYAALGYPVVADHIAGGLGPLAGVLTALESATTELVLTTPCDTPFLPPDLVTRLIAALERERADLCSAHDGERLHAAVLLLRVGRADALRAYLEGGGRRVRDWIASERHTSADFSDCPAAFANVNGPDDLAAAARRLAAPP